MVYKEMPLGEQELNSGSMSLLAQGNPLNRVRRSWIKG
jgi:hypothetical protein